MATLNIRSAVESSRLSRPSVARRAHVTERALDRACTDASNLALSSVAAVARAIHMGLDEAVGREARGNGRPGTFLAAWEASGRDIEDARNVLGCSLGKAAQAVSDDGDPVLSVAVQLADVLGCPLVVLLPASWQDPLEVDHAKVVASAPAVDWGCPDETKVKGQVAARMRAVREARHMERPTLEAWCGAPKKSWAAYERQKMTLSPGLVDAAAEALDVEPWELLGTPRPDLWDEGLWAEVEALPLSARLRRLRERAGESQERVAKASHVGSSSYGKYEGGDQAPRLVNAARIADHFGVPVAWLAGELCPPEPEPEEKSAARDPVAEAAAGAPASRILVAMEALDNGDRALVMGLAEALGRMDEYDHRRVATQIECDCGAYDVELQKS